MCLFGTECLWDQVGEKLLATRWSGAYCSLRFAHWCHVISHSFRQLFCLQVYYSKNPLWVSALLSSLNFLSDPGTLEILKIFH